MLDKLKKEFKTLTRYKAFNEGVESIYNQLKNNFNERAIYNDLKFICKELEYSKDLYTNSQFRNKIKQDFKKLCAGINMDLKGC